MTKGEVHQCKVTEMRPFENWWHISVECGRRHRRYGDRGAAVSVGDEIECFHEEGKPVEASPSWWRAGHGMPKRMRSARR